MVDNLKHLRERLEGWIDVSKAHLTRFIANLEENPGKALEWSRDQFVHAARAEVAHRLLEAMNNKDRDPAFTVQDARDWLQRQVLSHASHAESSTSIPSNFMDRQRLAAKAMLLENLSEMSL